MCNVPDITLEIYNSLTRKKQPFIPVEQGKVKMYVCGMTVYSDAHIGHARTYLSFDIIRRYFQYKGLSVTYVQNVTDVDDKIINAANKEGIDPLQYSQRFTDRCLKDLDDLGIQRADLYPKASETIPDMIAMIQQLITNDYAYNIEGDVYFSVEKFGEYGKLSGQNPEEMKSGARIEPGELKKSPLDFALWKQAKPGEPSWESPWGHGRPGWHIECSAMSSKFLGLPFDIHGGGMDLRFPHHENEIAQAEAATGKPFASFWIHTGFLTVDGEKMSKSLGNTITVKDLLSKTKWPELIRLFFALTHYRSPIDFSYKAVDALRKRLEQIHEVKYKLRMLCDNKFGDKTQLKNYTGTEKGYLTIIESFKKKFLQAMDNDFDTHNACVHLFSFIRQIHPFLTDNAVDSSLHAYAYSTLVSLGQILTLDEEKKIYVSEEGKVLSTEQHISLPAVLGKKIHIKRIRQIEDDLLKELFNIVSQYESDKDRVSQDTFEGLMHVILEVREQAKMRKEWDIADAIRNDLRKLNIIIEDSKDEITVTV